jgi:hypothetical protein
MKKFRFPLNLQLFADDREEIEFEIEDDGGEDFELEMEDDSDEEQEMPDGDGHQGAEGDEGEESGSDDQDAESEDDRQQQVKDKGKNETAGAVIAERKKWQAKMKAMEAEAKATKRFMEQVGVSDLDELNRRMDAFEADKLTKQGVPADLASRIASTERQLKEQQAVLHRQKYDVEAEKLKSDPFYSDLDEYREELEDIASRTGSTLKEAYLSQHAERRLKEREAEIEARVKSNKEKRQAKKVDTSPTGTSSNKSTRRVSLSSDERSIAKAAGMTPEEYAKYKKR